MIGEKNFDCQEMFMHACTFCECADMAFQKGNHDTAPIGFYDIPAYVNSAFACEVFLKTILKWYNIKTKKIHKLKDLYEAIPEEIQTFIKSKFHYSDGWIRSLGLTHLEILSNAFYDFRYVYERDLNKGGYCVETSFLTVFRDALRDGCSRLLFGIPWEEYKVSKINKKGK